jgi:hypothetical protein
MRVIRWSAIAVGAALVVLAIVAGATSRTPTLRRLVVETLSDRLNSEVELQAFSVDTFPAVDIRGEGLVLRLRGAGDLPPLIRIKSFAITGGMFGLLSRPRRFSSVTLEGLEINVPPGGPDLGSRARAGAAEDADRSSSSSQSSTSPIRIDELVSSDAVLRLIPKQAGKDPREFPIHHLRMTGVGVDQRMPFDAELTNPVPRGQIDTSGRFGPWSRDDPAATPVDGQYVFRDADLSTIKGIGGILTSTGSFTGALGRIEVTGTTETPDFRLVYANQPTSLSTEFKAIVDGTNGDTHLESVNARLGGTTIEASGAVVGTPGVKGRTVRVKARIPDGRIEDVLHLAVKSDKPVLTGRLALHTAMLLPPGEADVLDRLRLDGAFDLSSAKFEDAGVREKLAGMSERASAGDKDVRPETLLTDLEGKFALERASLSLSQLRFRIPGASVQLAGSYGLKSEALHFDGTLRMDATISEAAGGGMKSVFLKIVDPFFKKKGAGAVLPIRVRGTREDPKFGLDVVKALTPK